MGIEEEVLEVAFGYRTLIVFTINTGYNYSPTSIKPPPIKWPPSI